MELASQTECINPFSGGEVCGHQNVLYLWFVQKLIVASDTLVVESFMNHFCSKQSKKFYVIVLVFFRCDIGSINDSVTTLRS